MCTLTRAWKVFIFQVSSAFRGTTINGKVTNNCINSSVCVQIPPRSNTAAFPARGDDSAIPFFLTQGVDDIYVNVIRALTWVPDAQ